MKQFICSSQINQISALDRRTFVHCNGWNFVA